MSAPTLVRTPPRTAEWRKIPDAMRALWKACLPDEQGFDVARSLTVNFLGVPEYVSPTTGTGANTGTIVLQGNQVAVVYGACSLQDAIDGICPGNSIDPVNGNGAVDFSACDGIGCPTPPGVNRSVFEQFTPASPFDLQNRSFTFFPTTNTPANQYVLF